MVAKFKGDGQTKRKETPPIWQEPDNPNKSGFQYPNYTIWHTRSGHAVLRVDDTKGSESVSVEGRGGTGIHFLTNNGMKLVANYGRIDITYGQHRSVVTGAQDQTVRGDSSLRTEGKRRETNDSDFESVTNGKSVTAVAGSVSMTVGEGFNLAAEETTMKAGKMTFEAGDGPISLTGKGGVGLVSQGSSVGLSSETGSVGIKAAADIAVQGNEVHINGGGAKIVMKEGRIYINGIPPKTPPEAWT